MLKHRARCSGAFCVSLLFLGETFGYGCVHLIIEADNLHKLLGNKPIFLSWTQHDFMVLSFLIFLPLWWLRNLSILAYFSALGAFAGTMLFVGVAVSGFEGSEPNSEYCPPQNCSGSIFERKGPPRVLLPSSERHRGRALNAMAP